MENFLIIGIIALTALVSWQGWENHQLFERLKFQMDRIRNHGEYDRMFTSAFLHADFMHLAFNMFALWVFAPVVLSMFSSLTFVLIYVGAILAGSFLTLFFHQKEAWYSAVGASGGVSGIVFSAVMIYPDMPLQFIFLPFFDFPGWVFAIGYLAYSVFGMKTARDNIGHAAHLGGSIAGIVLTLAFAPLLIQQNMMYLLLMLIPLGVLGYLAWQKRAIE